VQKVKKKDENAEKFFCITQVRLLVENCHSWKSW